MQESFDLPQPEEDYDLPIEAWESSEEGQAFLINRCMRYRYYDCREDEIEILLTGLGEEITRSLVSLLRELGKYLLNDNVKEAGAPENPNDWGIVSFYDVSTALWQQKRSEDTKKKYIAILSERGLLEPLVDKEGKPCWRMKWFVEDNLYVINYLIRDQAARKALSEKIARRMATHQNARSSRHG